ncbi:hypothetical protein FRC10_006703 [Ceratobasidium sp. 414]|nr:hypothetical protein FRC10_006703 [Ceratobasidium sp. 414]
MWRGIFKRDQTASERINILEKKGVAQASPSEPAPPVKVGQVVLTRLLASRTAERYSAQAGHWRSFIHDPCFDTSEWSTPARPSVVVRVEWDDEQGMYSVSVVAITQRQAEVETMDIPMVWTSNSTSHLDTPQAVVVEPKWPLESMACYAFKRPMKFYCLPSQHLDDQKRWH